MAAGSPERILSWRRWSSWMDQVAHACGLDRREARVTLTEITGMSYRGQIVRTEVAEVHSMGVNGLGDARSRPATKQALISVVKLAMERLRG